MLKTIFSAMLFPLAASAATPQLSNSEFTLLTSNTRIPERIKASISHTLKTNSMHTKNSSEVILDSASDSWKETIRDVTGAVKSITTSSKGINTSYEPGNNMCLVSTINIRPSTSNAFLYARLLSKRATQAGMNKQMQSSSPTLYSIRTVGSIINFDRSRMLPLSIDYLDRNGDRRSRAEFHDYKNVHGHEIPAKTTVLQYEAGAEVQRDDFLIDYESININPLLTDASFEQLIPAGTIIDDRMKSITYIANGVKDDMSEESISIELRKLANEFKQHATTGK